MDRLNNSKEARVAVDTTWEKENPTVFVSETPPVSKKEKNSLPQPSLLVLMVRKVVNFFLDFLETIVVAMSIFVVVYLFLAQPHEIKGASMEPTFHNSEYILTDKISYRFDVPKRGDVVVFKSPRNPDIDFIKRIIGLPGETVKFENGKIYINGNQVDEPYLAGLTQLYPGGFLREGEEVTLPSSEYFVMGDNRAHSSDSREFGPINRRSIVGRAFIRYWPPGVAGVVPQANY